MSRRRGNLRSWLGAALWLGFASCAAPTDLPYTDVAVRVQRDVVFPGSSVPVHLINRAAQARRVDGCPRELQNLGDLGWRAIPLPACADVGYRLDGGEPIEILVQIPADAPFGEYRMLFDSYYEIEGYPVDARWVAPPHRIEVYSNRFYVPAIRPK